MENISVLFIPAVMADQSFCTAAGMQMNEWLFELFAERTFCIIHERAGLSAWRNGCVCTCAPRASVSIKHTLPVDTCSVNIPALLQHKPIYPELFDFNQLILSIFIFMDNTPLL